MKAYFLIRYKSPFFSKNLLLFKFIITVVFFTFLPAQPRYRQETFEAEAPKFDFLPIK